MWRLCSEQQIFSCFRRISHSARDPGPPVHDDLVQRDFAAQSTSTKSGSPISPNTDTNEGKLYLCSMKDALLDSHRRLLDR